MAFTANRVGWGFVDNSGWVEFTVSNTGSGAGTAFNLVVLAGFSSGGSTYYPNADWINEIDSFSVNGTYLAAGYNYAAGVLNGQYAYYTTLQFTSDPDGAGTGLDDMDGDGFFDDLPPGKSITIKAHAATSAFLKLKRSLSNCRDRGINVHSSNPPKTVIHASREKNSRFCQPVVVAQAMLPL